MGSRGVGFGGLETRGDLSGEGHSRSQDPPLPASGLSSHLQGVTDSGCRPSPAASPQAGSARGLLTGKLELVSPVGPARPHGGQCPESPVLERGS